MNIGKAIYDRRTALGLSQGNLEDRTGIDRCRYSMYENGRKQPSLRLIEQIAKGLEWKASELVAAAEVES